MCSRTWLPAQALQHFVFSCAATHLLPAKVFHQSSSGLFPHPCRRTCGFWESPQYLSIWIASGLVPERDSTICSDDSNVFQFLLYLKNGLSHGRSLFYCFIYCFRLTYLIALFNWPAINMKILVGEYAQLLSWSLIEGSVCALRNSVIIL